MADTLSTFSEAMSLLPDNTSRLIDPSDHRSASISLLADKGGVFGDTAAAPWVIPIPAVDTWVDIPLAMAADIVESDGVLFWRKDANGHLFYDYAADWPTIVVPPGHIRQVTFLGVVNFDPDGSTWQFAFSIGGVIQEPIYTVETAGAVDALVVTIISGDPIDVSLAPPVSLQVKNLSNANDLNLNLISFRTEGGPQA